MNTIDSDLTVREHISELIEDLFDSIDDFERQIESNKNTNHNEEDLFDITQQDLIGAFRSLNELQSIFSRR